MRHSGPWIVIVLLALACLVVPWWWAWSNMPDKRRVPRKLINDAPPQPGPLILYADTWPTRATLKIAEIQAATTETDHALGPKAVATDVALALSELGISVEAQRLDDLPKDADLLTGRPIVLIYPVRHGYPPAAIMQFIDTRLEPLVGDQDSALSRLHVSDIAIAEGPQQAAQAQQALTTIMGYYHLSYKPGTTLLEPMNSIVIYERLQAFARTIPTIIPTSIPAVSATTTP